MKIIKLKIERCGDCPNITFFGSWVCKLMNECVSLGTIPLLCPLEDDATKTCATCRYWGEAGHIRDCNSDKLAYGMNEKYLKDGLQYIDCGNYKAFLWTGPDFGCIHHEAKDR